MSAPRRWSPCLTLTAQTLTVFLGVVLAKRYTNPSSEIITVLSGLDDVDDIFLEFTNVIEKVVRSEERSRPNSLSLLRPRTNCVIVEFRQKAIEVAIALTAGAYQTSLVSYFTHRDLFPCLMKVRLMNSI